SSSGESSTSLMDPTLVTKEVFHNLKEPLISKWSLQTNYEAFYDKSLWQKCLHAWVDNHEDEVEEEMRQEIEAFKQRNDVSPPLNHIKTIVGRRHIASLLAGNLQLLDELLQAFLEPALPLLQNHSPLKQVPYKKRKNGPFQLQTSTPRTRIKTSNHRQRQPWSDEETKELIHLHLHKKASWVEIASTLPQQIRTNVDCKDKWRNLLLKAKTIHDSATHEENTRLPPLRQEWLNESSLADALMSSIPSKPTTSSHRTKVQQEMISEGGEEEEEEEEEEGEEQQQQQQQQQQQEAVVMEEDPEAFLHPHWTASN
ncbi:hypothetical protein QOT17_017618, partial [Balamuthia mandrillaris]